MVLVDWCSTTIIDYGALFRTLPPLSEEVRSREVRDVIIHKYVFGVGKHLCKFYQVHFIYTMRNTLCMQIEDFVGLGCVLCILCNLKYHKGRRKTVVIEKLLITISI